MENGELLALLCRCVEEYHWMWGVTGKFLYAKTGVHYSAKELKRMYAAARQDRTAPLH